MGLVTFGQVPNHSTLTHSVVTVGSSSTTVLNANDNRTYALLINDSDETIYIKLGATAVANEGIRINANGGSYEISPANANLFTGYIRAICASGSKKLLVTEA
jgi:hypothetical protein